jgi:3-hydroxyanthranilate 3,4-dioxygenase
VGLVIERVRQKGMIDAHEWYCERCNCLLFRKEVGIDVLERDMPPVFEAYYSEPLNQLCRGCGYRNPGRPAPPLS